MVDMGLLLTMDSGPLNNDPFVKMCFDENGLMPTPADFKLPPETLNHPSTLYLALYSFVLEACLPVSRSTALQRGPYPRARPCSRPR